MIEIGDVTFFLDKTILDDKVSVIIPSKKHGLRLSYIPRWYLTDSYSDYVYEVGYNDTSCMLLVNALRSMEINIKEIKRDVISGTSIILSNEEYQKLVMLVKISG